MRSRLIADADRGAGEPISLGAALLAGKKVAPAADNLLMEDHRVVLGWFAWYREAGDDQTKLRVTRKICKTLRAHMAAEESELYPLASEQAGDGDLARRAAAEHEQARQIVGELERAGGVDDRHAELMAGLEREIAGHVDEEETELLPMVRGSGVDMYGVGAALAARRVDELFGLSGSTATVKEYPKMPIAQEQAEKFFVIGLRDIHAAARQGRTLVESQLQRIEQYPKIKAKLESHLKEKDAQLERIEAILERHNESRSAVKDATMSAAAALSGLAHATAEDEIVKNSFATLALAKFEAAAYETLLLFGDAAGDREALRLLQKSLSEERSMASFIEENLRSTGMQFLQLKSEGAQASH